MKRKNWSVAALLASVSILASVGIAQEENSAPSVMGIPGESIDEGKKFAPIKLDKYVTDEDKPEKIKWSVSGNKQLKVSISPERVATIEIQQTAEGVHFS